MIDDPEPPLCHVSLYLRNGISSELFADLCEMDPSIPGSLDAVVREVQRYDPFLVRQWVDAGLRDKLATYSLRYIVPFRALLLGAHANETGLLAAQLISCLAWRTYDNCVDSHQSPRVAHRLSLATCMGLLRYVESTFAISAAENLKSVELHYRLMADQVDRELQDPIPVDEIWKRCSIFLYVPEALAKLNDPQLRLFRDYLNYIGLAHDLSDILSDIAGGAVSLPIRWLSDSAEFGVVNVATIERVFDSARQVVRPIEEAFSAARIEDQYPVFHRLVRDLSKIFDGR